MEYAKVTSHHETLYHTCEEAKYDGIIRAHGSAIEMILKEPGDVWTAGNNEYSSPVKFCPFCGLKLPD